MLMIDALGYSFSPDARDVLRRYLDRRIGQPWFANARSVRNALGTGAAAPRTSAADAVRTPGLTSRR